MMSIESLNFNLHPGRHLYLEIQTLKIKIGKQNYLFYLTNGESSSSLKFWFVGRMFSTKYFIHAFKTFSTKLIFDGPCRRCYQISKTVVILYLNLTVCQGVEVKNCIGNTMFDKSTNKCIGEYLFTYNLRVYLNVSMIKNLQALLPDLYYENEENS